MGGRSTAADIAKAQTPAAGELNLDHVATYGNIELIRAYSCDERTDNNIASSRKKTQKRSFAV